MSVDNEDPLHPNQPADATVAKPVGAAQIALWAVVVILFLGAGLIFEHRMPTATVTLHSAQTTRSGNAIIGAAAPDFPLQRIEADSTRQSSLSEFAGHPLWVNFFATWCPPCKAEMPEIERRFVAHQNDGLFVLGLDQQETPMLVRNFGRAYGLSFPLAIDAGAGAIAYGRSAIPMSIFIDSSGIVRGIYRGQMPPGEMDTALLTIHKGG